MKKSKSYLVAAAAGSIILLTLFARYGIMEYAIRKIVSSKIKLAPGNDVWKIWSEMPVPMFSKFYFFNVTNPDQVLQGAKPIVNEMGPYVYQHKIILEANDDIVRYRPKITYIFRPDMSHGSQDDNVTLLNVPYVAVAKIAWDVSKESFMLSTLDDLLAGKGETLFHTNKVREFLLDGFSIENYMELFSLPVEAFGVKTEIPERILDGDFGFFDDVWQKSLRNGTADETWTVGAGVKDIKDFGRISSFNGRTSLDAWDSDVCDKIQGSDGTIFPPVFELSRILDVFHPDICRTIQLSYVEPGEFLELPTHRYSFARNTFESLDLHPENECFCKETYEWCRKGGVFPIWPCVGGAPVFISRPHFMNSNKEYTQAVIGFNEDRDYSTVVDIEQNVGLPIRADIKLQMNIELQSFGSMATFLNVPNLMFPIFWMEENLELSEEAAKPLKHLHYVLRVGNTLTEWTVMTSLVVFLVAAFIESRNSKWVGQCLGVKFG